VVPRNLLLPVFLLCKSPEIQYFAEPLFVSSKKKTATTKPVRNKTIDNTHFISNLTAEFLFVADDDEFVVTTLLERERGIDKLSLLGLLLSAI
jgi:hypothetical protein